MPRVSPILTSFNAGEWSPLLYGRVDIQKYGVACRKLENFIPLPQGPITRRPGTRYVADTKGDQVARLIPFEFSTIQAYVLEFTDLFMRVYMNQGQVFFSGSPYQIASPYTLAQLAGLKWAQSADTMYLCHTLVRPKKLTRTGHTAWTIGDLDFLDGPYLPQNVTATTLTLSSNSGSVTVTASAALFASTDVARLIRFFSGNWTWLQITAFGSSTSVTATIRGDAPAAITATAAWRLGAWSDTTGWPSCVSFYEQRLVFAATTNQPNTIWASKSGDFENFQPTTTPSSPAPATLDDNAITATISDDRVNAIRWMSAGQQLAIGTVGGEFTLQAGVSGAAMTPSNAKVSRQTTRGSADQQAIRIGFAVLFLQRARRKLYGMSYSFQYDAQVTSDLALLSSHIPRANVAAYAWQAQPWGVIWMCMDDGTLAGLTYLPDEQVTGWHRHPIGGAAVKVLSVIVIPGTTQDEVWMVVERTINGATVRFVEFMTYEFWPANPTDQEYAIFSDASLALDNTIAQTLTPGAGAAVKGTTGVTFTAGGALFAAADVGREIRYRYLDSTDPFNPLYRTARAQITGFVSATAVTAMILVAFTSTLPIAASAWRLTVTQISGLGHLEGQTVKVLADGASHADKTVAGGTIALDRPATIVQIGLGYTSRLETQDIEFGAADGTAQGKRRRTHEVAVKLYSTLGALVGRAGQMDEIQFRDASQAMDAPPALFTGDQRVAFAPGWDTQNVIRVEQQQPLPCTITALEPRLVTNDG